MSDVPFHEQDDMRLCPICRMPISVLATKCRHCGGEVARPRKKEASLTIRDLGGNENSGYAPSGDVMEAIESFRAEVLSAQTKEGSAGGGLPELDARSRDLMQFAIGGTPVQTPRPAANQQLDTKRLLLWILGLAAGVIVLFGLYKSIEQLTREEVIEQPSYVSRVPQLIASKAQALDVLREAQEAIRRDASPENLKALNDARTYLTEEVHGLINADPWEPEMLERASRLTSEAVGIDNDARIRELRQQVLDEVAAYSMFLSVNAGDNTVTYRKSAQATEAETVGEGDLMGGRFEVLRVSPRQVRMEDTLRASRGGGRILIYWVDRAELKSGAGA